VPQLGWCSVLASTQHTARTPLLPLSFQLNGLGLVGSADFADRDLDLGLLGLGLDLEGALSRRYHPLLGLDFRLALHNLGLALPLGGGARLPGRLDLGLLYLDLQAFDSLRLWY